MCFLRLLPSSSFSLCEEILTRPSVAQKARRVNSKLSGFTWFWAVHPAPGYDRNCSSPGVTGLLPNDQLRRLALIVRQQPLTTLEQNDLHGVNRFMQKTRSLAALTTVLCICGFVSN